MSALTGPAKTAQPVITGVSVSVIMLFLVAALVARSVINLWLTANGLTPHVAKQLSALAGFAVLALLLWPLRGRLWRTVKEQFARSTSWPNLILTSVALGFVLWLWQMLALVALTPLSWPDSIPFAAPTAPTYSLACRTPEFLLLSIPVMAIATPIIEEILHRGIILHALFPSGRTTAVLLSALLFAVLHKPGTIPYAFIFGAFLALQAVHCRNLWAPIITHAVTNLLVVISASCLVGHWQPGTISWAVLSPATLIAFSMLACTLAAWTLATSTKAGAEPAGSTPA